MIQARRILLGSGRADPDDRRWGVIVGVATLAAVGLIAGAMLARSDYGLNRIVGTPKPDHLQGTRRADVITGRGGGDHIEGYRGADILRGNKGYDVIRAGGGNDRLLGGGGGAVLNGGKGRDEFNMVDGKPQGGKGDNLIRARDGAADEINCGGGHDTAYVDRIEDGVYNCEEVREPPSQH